jgi:uncharacterized protein (DUF305 family)
MNKNLAAGAASAALVLALTACGDSGSDQNAGATSTTAGATTSASAGQNAGEHNDADVAFARGMVPHHTQAIEMSDMLLAKQGIDPRVVTLAQQIKAAQTPEIDQLNAWLQQWGQASPTTSAMNMTGESMPMNTGMQMPEAPPQIGSTSGMGMPTMPGMGEDSEQMEGMMSAEDMQALGDAQGVDAAKLFLNQMIEHHQGAIAMARTEVEDGQNPQAKAMAQTIIDTQQQEITTMEQILSTL